MRLALFCFDEFTYKDAKNTALNNRNLRNYYGKYTKNTPTIHHVQRNDKQPTYGGGTG